MMAVRSIRPYGENINLKTEFNLVLAGWVMSETYSLIINSIVKMIIEKISNPLNNLKKSAFNPDIVSIATAVTFKMIRVTMK